MNSPVVKRSYHFATIQSAQILLASLENLATAWCQAAALPTADSQAVATDTFRNFHKMDSEKISWHLSKGIFKGMTTSTRLAHNVLSHKSISTYHPIIFKYP